MAFASITEYYNSMYASTLHNMGRKVYDQTFYDDALLYWLEKKHRETVAGGRSIKRPVQLRESTTSKSFGRGATFDSVDPDLLTMVSFDMRNVGNSLTRFWVDEQENTGEAEIINLVQTNIGATLRGLRKTVNTQLWAGTPGSIDLYSVPYFVSEDPTTGTVAGINRANESDWRNQFKNMSGRSAYTYLLDDLRDSRIDAKKKGSPDYYVAGTTAYSLYFAVAGEQKSIVNKTMGDAEFENCGYAGMPFTLSYGCAADNIYGIDSSTWEWGVSPSASFKWTPWKERPNGLDREAQLVLRAQLLNTLPGANHVVFNVAA